MSHTFHQLRYHVIFSTKDRQPLIHTDWAQRLYSYIGTVLESEGAGLLTAGGIEDHIHLLMWAKPIQVPANLVRAIKANSSRWISDTIGQRAFAWQTGYGIFTVTALRPASPITSTVSANTTRELRSKRSSASCSAATR